MRAQQNHLFTFRLGSSSSNDSRLPTSVAILQKKICRAILKKNNNHRFLMNIWEKFGVRQKSNSLKGKQGE